MGHPHPRWIGERLGQPPDEHAPEWQQGSGTVPLLDFFPLTTARPFVPIVISSPYDVNYFQNYFINNPSETPDGPDANDD